MLSNISNIIVKYTLISITIIIQPDEMTDFKPKTPFDRLMANKGISQEKKEILLSVYRNLDPVELKNDIEETVIKIFKLR